MDSWKYSNISEGKNVWLSEGVDYQVEDHNCKSKFMGSESENKPILNNENYPLISNTQALDRLDFMDLGFADDIRKSYSISSEPSGEVFSDEIGTSDYHPQLGEERESNDFMQSNNQDFSLVDLKLGSLRDGGIVRGSELSKVDVPESSMMVSPVKRARPSNPSCQVLGCNKDLGSFKSYYKRHKVCDVHTKTPKVIVDGIEQRFCQQCSRFHLLNEFDDIKRSCRRRLAAHNKRRRRPQLTSEPGSGIIDFSASLAFPEGMPNVFLGSNKYEGTEDSSKTSNFHLQMGCVEEKMDKIPENIKGNIFGLMKPAIDNTPCIQHTSRALSLLSAQSQSISSHHLLESTTSTPLVNKSISADSINHHSAGIIKRIAQSGPHTSGIYSMEADEEGPSTLNPSNGNTVGLQLQDDGISSRPSLRGNDYLNPKGHGIILNLLQLSSNLERVEHQRHSTENEAG